VDESQEFNDFDLPRREAALVYQTGRCGAEPSRVGSGKQKTGEARFLVGAREGEALPLNEFDFKIFKSLNL
jgi:hypothetical protein